jgi:hypothetical protein
VPCFLASCDLVGGDEPAHAFITAGGSGNDERADYQRRRRGVVVLAPVGHLGIPNQLAREAVQRNHVRVIREHEQAVARRRDAAVDAAGGVAGQPFGARQLVVPEFAAAPGIECPGLVRARDVHDAFDHERRGLD